MRVDIVDVENRVAALERRLEQKERQIGQLDAQIYNLKMKCKQLAVEMQYCRKSSSPPGSFLGPLDKLSEIEDDRHTRDTQRVIVEEKCKS